MAFRPFSGAACRGASEPLGTEGGKLPFTRQLAFFCRSLSTLTTLSVANRQKLGEGSCRGLFLATKR